MKCHIRPYRFKILFEFESLLPIRFVFDSNANGRFAGPYYGMYFRFHGWRHICAMNIRHMVATDSLTVTSCHNTWISSRSHSSGPRTLDRAYSVSARILLCLQKAQHIRLFDLQVRYLDIYLFYVPVGYRRIILSSDQLYTSWFADWSKRRHVNFSIIDWPTLHDNLSSDIFT